MPVGGNTGLNGGTAAPGALMLSLARMRRIRDLNPAARTVVAEAGVVLETLQDLAAAQGAGACRRGLRCTGQLFAYRGSPVAPFVAKSQK